MMGKSGDAVIAAVVVIVLLIGAAFVWYTFTGWKTFSYTSGDTPAWTPAGQADISRLRFRSCLFTVSRSDGVKRALNVSPALNSMAVAFAGGPNNPPALTLTGPLNAFSFVIPGFNDRATVTDPAAAPWCTDAGCAGATLVGKVRTI
jgi:hypothetical protein